MGAFAVERSYSVMTGGSVMARSTGTVIDVLAAVVPSPAIHTHALVAAVGVVARATILAGVGHQLALIDILCAKLTCGRTRGQRVKVYILNTQMWYYTFSFLTKKEHWNVAVQTCKFWFTLTVVGVDSIYTCSSILALVTWTVINVVVAVFSCKT